MEWDALLSYDFLLIALGTAVLAGTSAMVGTISVLKGQSLIGDAIGHASFPGVILAFIFFISKDPLILLSGAIFSGVLAFLAIQMLSQNSKLQLDTVLAVVLSTFFAFGMVLKTYIQGNPRFVGTSQAGLKNYIFGQAAYMMEADVIIILVVSLIALILLFLFYKEIKVFVFDSLYSSTSGFNSSLINTVILIMSMSLIAVGLKVVGAILISSMLIAPAIAALQWSQRYSVVLLFSCLFGIISAVLGTYFSYVTPRLSTGSTIVCFMSILALISIVIGPRGVIYQYFIRKKWSKK